MKKITFLILCLSLVFSFVACGDNTENSTTAGAESTVAENTTVEATTENTVTEETTAAEEETAVTEETTSAEEETAAADETTKTPEEETAATDETTKTSEEVTAETKNASVTVEQVEDIAGEYGTVFNASTDEYAFYAVFRTDVKITDVKVLGLTFVDADESGAITFDKEVLHTVDEIGPDFNLAVHLTVDGSIPAYGISYVDTDGTIKSFSVNMNGEDGSLYLAEIK